MKQNSPGDNGRAQSPSRVDAVGADRTCDPHVEGDAQGNCKRSKLPPAPAQDTHRCVLTVPNHELLGQATTFVFATLNYAVYCAIRNLHAIMKDTKKPLVQADTDKVCSLGRA